MGPSLAAPPRLSSNDFHPSPARDGGWDEWGRIVRSEARLLPRVRDRPTLNLEDGMSDANAKCKTCRLTSPEENVIVNRDGSCTPIPPKEPWVILLSEIQRAAATLADWSTIYSSKPDDGKAGLCQALSDSLNRNVAKLLEQLNDKDAHIAESDKREGQLKKTLAMVKSQSKLQTDYERDYRRRIEHKLKGLYDYYEHVTMRQVIECLDAAMG